MLKCQFFGGFSLISMLKRSISFSKFNRTLEPNQSILIIFLSQILFFRILLFESIVDYVYGGGKVLKKKGKKKVKVRSTLFKGCIFYFNGRTINSSALHIQVIFIIVEICFVYMPLRKLFVYLVTPIITM